MAICKNHFGVDISVHGEIAAGLADNSGYFLIAETQGLGHGLLWATRNGVAELNVLCTDSDIAAKHALTALGVKGLDVKVFTAIDGEVDEASPAEAHPLPNADAALIEAANDLVSKSDAASGLAVVSQRSAKITGGEGLVIEADYASVSSTGLEVARVLEYKGEPVIEIGVGQADREIHALTSEGLPEEILAAVMFKVQSVRSNELERFHPLSNLDPAGQLRYKQMLSTNDTSELVPNVDIDDVFTESPRATYNKDNQTLTLYVAQSSPNVYEHTIRYVQALGDSNVRELVVCGPDKDLRYIDETVLALAGLPVSTGVVDS